MTRLHYFRVDLTLKAAGAVLEPDPLANSGEPDASPVSDGQGGFTIPGSSLAGSLRAHATAAAADHVDVLFGFARGDTAEASRVWVLGSTVAATKDDLVTERSTAIDRQRNAARNRALRTRRFLPKGTKVTVYLMAERLDDVLAGTLDEVLASWHPTLGAGASTGHGAMTVNGVRKGSLDLTDRADLKIYLTTSGPALVEAVVENDLTPRAPRDGESFTIAFDVDGSLAVGSGDSFRDGAGEVAAVLRSGGQPVVPASTWKGIVRSRVEYVLRSLTSAGRQGPCLDGACGTCVPCLIFGYAGASGSRRSVVAFHDSVLTGTVSSSGGHRIHVAIDRFTGGAASGLLYTNEVVEDGAAVLTMTRLGGTDEQWALAKAFATLVARDIDLGFVAVGGSTTRGYGRLRLSHQFADDDLAAAQAMVRSAVNGLMGGAA